MDTWSDLCRCCLSSNSTVSILDSHEDISQKFLEITTIEVKHDDSLPQKLCIDCFSIMNTAYQFRKQCIKMDTDLKQQIESLINESKETTLQKITDNMSEDDNNDIGNDPIKQLEAIIKREPTDSDADDDCYYVLVIDDPKDATKENDDVETIPDDDEPIVKTEKVCPSQEVENRAVELEEMTIRGEDLTQDTKHHFENTIDSFLVSNTKVPVNVPATILENEEESQENDDNFDMMEVDTLDSNSQEQTLAEIDAQENTDMESYPDNMKLIKILTTTAPDGTIVLKSGDYEYLRNSQLVSAADDGDHEQEEVIYCEGDDASQFQILKCEGSELVIEYADDGQIATVLQQEDGTFLCDCGEQFEDLSEYEKHQYTHIPSDEHLCNLCGKGFESAEILTGHTLLHSVTGLLVTCPFCNQVVKRNSLTQHIKYGHNNIKPRCNLCLKTFANPNNLKRHMMIHTGIREFECDICFRRFHQKITMQTHRLLHMNPFSCNECNETYEGKEDLNSHKESGECTKTKVIKVKEELMKTVKQEVTTTVGKLLGYACSLCKKMFSLESALEQHVESTHILDPSDLLCSECGEVLPTKKDMQSHIATHKSMKSKLARRFECNLCGKGCSSQAMLLMHVRVHTNERPFPCQLCSLRFKTKTHLRTHQLTHTREKKFGCSVCMKFFALKGNLVVHLRTHTGERPYICSICGEAFIDSKYLKKHKLKKHSIDNVPWNKY